MRKGVLHVSLRVALASSYQFANVRTALVALLWTPLLEVALLAAVLVSAGTSELRTSAYAAILVTAATSVIGLLSSHLATDRLLGTVRDALRDRLLNTPYWFGRMAVAVALSAAVSTLEVVGVLAIDPSHAVLPFERTLALLPAALATGVVVGAAAATISLLFADPYSVANVVSFAVPILAGVAAPLSSYPALVRWLAYTTPMASIVSMLRASPNSPVLGEAVGALAVLVAWTIAAVLSRRAILRRVRTGLPVFF